MSWAFGSRLWVSGIRIVACPTTLSIVIPIRNNPYTLVIPISSEAQGESAFLSHAYELTFSIPSLLQA